MKYFLKILPAVILWGAVVYVIFNIPYPFSITQANAAQLLSFFIPLFLAIIFTVNLFLKNIFISVSISLGLIFLLVLKALDSLNLVSGILIIIIVILLFTYFQKKKGRKKLTNLAKIPKLTQSQK